MVSLYTVWLALLLQLVGDELKYCERGDGRKEAMIMPPPDNYR